MRLLRMLAAALAIACAMHAAVAQVKTKAAISNEISTNLADNTSGLITPAIMRGLFGDVLNSYLQGASVNAQTGTSYTVQCADMGALITLSNSSPVAVSLPPASNTCFNSNWAALFKNNGSGLVTITPTGGLINGASSITIASNQGYYVFSDGTNYQVWGFGNLGTFAFQNYATPPAIGATTAAAGYFNPLHLPAVTGSTQCLQVDTTGLVSGTGFSCTAGGRTRLSGSTTFYFSLSGNDSTGNGSSGNPWRHLAFAYSFVQANYDTAGNTVTFHTNDTSVTFPDCFVATGMLVGQGSAGNVIIDYNGNSTEGTTANCTGGNIYAMGANGNASYTFENVSMSVCGTANTAGNGNDMVNVGQGSTLFVGVGVTYGCAWGQWNQNSVNGILVVQNNYTIQAKNVTTTGTWASSGNTVSVTNATGLLLGFGSLTVGGGNDCLITSSSPSLPTTGAATLTLSRDINAANTTCSFTTSGTGASITFNSGGNGHWGIGAAGQVVCATNNVPNTQKIAVQGNPMFFQAFVYALQLSQINCGAEWFVNGNAYGPPFLAQGGSLLYGHGMGLPYWPGSGYNGTLTANFTGGSATATLSSSGGTYVVNGAGISDTLAATGCTTTAGSGVISGCNSPTGQNCASGDTVVNTSNVPTGVTVASVTATSVTLATGQAAQTNGSGVTVNCTGHWVTWNSLNGTYIVSGASGTSIVMSQPALTSGTNIPVTIGGLVSSGGQIN